MLGLGTQFHDADNQLSRLSVSKQPSSSEDSEERKEVSSEQQVAHVCKECCTMCIMLAVCYVPVRLDAA